MTSADIAPTAEADAPPARHRAALAYAQIADEMAALSDADLIPIRTDSMKAVTTVLGVVPQLEMLRPDIEATFKQFDFVRFDKLSVYALGLIEANVRWRMARAPEIDVEGLARELVTARKQLTLYAVALAAHGLIDGEPLKRIRRRRGYLGLAEAVSTLAALLRQSWDTIEGKAPIDRGILNAHASKAMELLAAVGRKRRAPVSRVEAASNRVRAFTLLARAYEDARRAVLYLRPKDGDDIAPSLYAGRGGRGSVRARSQRPVEAEARAEMPAAARSSAAAPFNPPPGVPATPLVN